MTKHFSFYFISFKSLKKSATDDLKRVTAAFNCMCKSQASVLKSFYVFQLNVCDFFWRRSSKKCVQRKKRLLCFVPKKGLLCWSADGIHFLFHQNQKILFAGLTNVSKNGCVWLLLVEISLEKWVALNWRNGLTRALRYWAPMSVSELKWNLRKAVIFLPSNLNTTHWKTPNKLKTLLL